MKSPTQLSLEYARKETGYPLIQVVEHWNPHAKIRQDLFGIIDILLCGSWGTLGVQATSASNKSARIAKLLSHKSTKDWLAAPGRSLEVWSWHKRKVKRGGTAVRNELVRTYIYSTKNGLYAHKEPR